MNISKRSRRNFNLSLCDRLRTRPHAFTLIELLVVIGIIALLISILLPALRRATDFSRTVQCSSNLRQIGLSVILYVNDNHGSLPFALDQGATTFSPTYTPSGLPSLLAAGRYLVPPSSTVSGALPRASVYRCPEGTDTPFTGAFTGVRAIDMTNSALQTWQESTYKPAASVLYVQSWYGINSVTNNANTPFPFDALQPGTAFTLKTKKITIIRQTSDVIALYDSWGTIHNRNDGRVAARHRNRTATNVLFMDGHVGTLNTLKEVPTISIIPANSGPTFAIR